MTATKITQAQFLAVTGNAPSDHMDCANCPVEMVTWTDADSFRAAVGGRLPTEAEWEYAARAGTDTIFSCGDDPSCLADVAWYSDNSDSLTHEVGGKTANAWDLFDMEGNVQEWTNDWYWDQYYANSPTNDPPGATSDQGSLKVMRGGSYMNTTTDHYLWMSFRAVTTPDMSATTIGIRCAKD